MITVQGVDYLEDNYQLDDGAEAAAEGQRSGVEEIASRKYANRE